MNQINTEWIYIFRKAMNYRVYSNPQIMSNIIDIVSEELYKVYGNRVRMFNYDDINKTIMFKVEINPNLDNNIELRRIVENSIMRFCVSHRSIIELSIRELGGFQYQKIFTDLLDNNQIISLSQIITTRVFNLYNEITTSMRFF